MSIGATQGVPHFETSHGSSSCIYFDLFNDTPVLDTQYIARKTYASRLNILSKKSFCPPTFPKPSAATREVISKRMSGSSYRKQTIQTTIPRAAAALPKPNFLPVLDTESILALLDTRKSRYFTKQDNFDILPPGYLVQSAIIPH